MNTTNSVLRNIHVIPAGDIVNSRNADIYDGKTVTGRVLEKAADGQYIVSLAGRRLLVSSNLSLLKGEPFSATVKIYNGLVYLMLEENGSLEKSAVLRIGGNDTGGSLSASAIKLLTELGIEPSQISFRLVQILCEMREKIDKNLINRVLIEFQGENDENLLELALLLGIRGIPFNRDFVKKILYERESRKSKDNKRQYLQPSDETDETANKKSVKRYFESVDLACKNQRAGALTLFNMIKSAQKNKSGNLHWLLLPFESRVHDFKGDFRVLIDKETFTVKKIVIFAKKNMKKKIFVIYFNKNAIESIDFGFYPDISESKKKMCVQIVKTLFADDLKYGCSVSYCDFSLISNLCAANESVSVFRGMA